MYTSVWELVRLSESDPFPGRNEALESLRNTATGFIKKEVELSNNNLTKLIKTRWDSEESAANFLNNNFEVLEQANQLLAMHCEENNISITRSVENTWI